MGFGVLCIGSLFSGGGGKLVEWKLLFTECVGMRRLNWARVWSIEPV